MSFSKVLAVIAVYIISNDKYSKFLNNAWFLYGKKKKNANNENSIETYNHWIINWRIYVKVNSFKLLNKQLVLLIFKL